MKKYKKKLNREQAEGLKEVIIEYLSMNRARNVIAVMIEALLSEILTDISRKLADPFKREISINWKTAEAMAMQLMLSQWTDQQHIMDYMYHVSMRMIGEIDQLFA